jgi:uncharacterized protein HemX
MAPRPTAEEQADMNASKVKGVLNALQILAVIVALAAVPGQWFVYRDRQTRSDERIQQLEHRLEGHMDDKTIHVTEDQMKTVIAAQLAPVNATLAELKVKNDAQQAQLDRMERMLERITDSRQPKS